MKTLAIIPARKGSKRLPNKNRLTLGGKTLVELAVECAVELDFVDDIVVTSDDVFHKHQDATFIARPSCLADDHATTEAVVAHAIRCMGRYDTVLIVQPTTPLRSVDFVRSCQEDFCDEVDSVVSMTDWQRDGACYLTRGRLAAMGELYGDRILLRKTPPGQGVSIDTQEDWEEVQRIWEATQSAKSKPASVAAN